MSVLMKLTFMLTAVTVGVNLAIAQDIMPAEDAFEAPKREYSPFVDDHFPIRPLFGDTHVHTSWSADAGMLGGTLGPDTAYRFARGETVDSRDGWRVKMPRPLDFIVVPLFFSGKTTRNVRSFTLISAPIAVDDVLFKIPDLHYEVGTVKQWDMLAP